MMMFENGGLSLTRVISLLFVLLFIGVTIYLVFFDFRWDHYETLATMAAGGGPMTQVANKFINSKYNSGIGTYEERKGAE
jgi:hypothetical protein|nr:MAG TPA: hypothetical protein [Caudoviricetes sp.]